ncbi:hypothetical protein BN129_2244 [Cronobacter sakazakii 701]|nr:hypothetical protein BN129_2244 [Cronobacter sakazakii 701]
MNDVKTKMVAEHIHHLLGFVQAQQAVINGHAGQTVANRAVQQHGGDGGVHAAGEAQDHAIVTHLLTNALNRVVDDFRRRPQRFALTDVAHKALQHTQALTGVSHFRVELHAVETLLFVRHDRERTGFGAGDGHEIRRNSGHFIAVAHPDIQQRVAVGAQRIFNTTHQRAVGFNFYLRITEFTLVRTFHMAAQLHRHGLHTVANAKHRHTGVKDIFRRARAVFFSGALRATGKDNPVRIKAADLLFRHVPGPQFTVNAQLTHAARHQLGVLRTEVEDKDTMLMNVVRH